MAGVDIEFLLGVVLFLCGTWLSGRFFRLIKLPGILGELFAGILLGPQVLDLVPFASDGNCPALTFGVTAATAANVTANSSHRMLGASSSAASDCRWIHMWNGGHTLDVWSFAGTFGVTLMIMESGMHINFEKVGLLGWRPFAVAIIGTFVPMLCGMVLIAAFFPGEGKFMRDGFAAGCALAPTSVGISIKLLSDAKMLNSMAGQTVLTGAFVDDVFAIVLLVILGQVGSGNTEVGLIVMYTLLAFGFLGAGVLLAKFVYPRVMPYVLEPIRDQSGVSIQPRSELHLTIMIFSLVGFAAIGAQIGSHLLGAFVAGMCFTEVPMSHHIFAAQFKRVNKWLVRIFFAATIGFSVPVRSMLSVPAFLKGAAIGLSGGILCKLVSGVAARLPYKSAEQRQNAAKSSPATCGGMVQPLQYLVGCAMIARGEFAFLVASIAAGMRDSSGVPMLGPDEYAAVVWGLVWALISAPFLFKWALGMYGRSAPIIRGELIGGKGRSGEDFIISIKGKHHTGMLHEVIDTLHAEGLDIVEARAAVTGGNPDAEHEDMDAFVVRPRGKQKDFDDEKLKEIKHHLMEMMGHGAGEIDFTSLEPAMSKSRSLSVCGKSKSSCSLSPSRMGTATPLPPANTAARVAPHEPQADAADAVQDLEAADMVEVVAKTEM